ncbi:uncharacterized protein LOC143232654 [Tachypleus tridentatus]|uniref:uncharacterized protein LOC143232654 n=1 Tax=Tachypleus tridentatus TaxID=6853 RepID=UPI003FD0B0C1
MKKYEKYKNQVCNDSLCGATAEEIWASRSDFLTLFVRWSFLGFIGVVLTTVSSEIELPVRQIGEPYSDHDYGLKPSRHVKTDRIGTIRGHYELNIPLGLSRLVKFVNGEIGPGGITIEHGVYHSPVKIHRPPLIPKDILIKQVPPYRVEYGFPPQLHYGFPTDIDYKLLYDDSDPYLPTQFTTLPLSPLNDIKLSKLQADLPPQSPEIAISKSVANTPEVQNVPVEQVKESILQSSSPTPIDPLPPLDPPLSGGQFDQPKPLDIQDEKVLDIEKGIEEGIGEKLIQTPTDKVSEVSQLEESLPPPIEEEVPAPPPPVPVITKEEKAVIEESPGVSVPDAPVQEPIQIPDVLQETKPIVSKEGPPTILQKQNGVLKEPFLVSSVSPNLQIQPTYSNWDLDSPAFVIYPRTRYFRGTAKLRTIPVYSDTEPGYVLNDRNAFHFRGVFNDEIVGFPNRPPVYADSELQVTRGSLNFVNGRPDTFLLPGQSAIELSSPYNLENKGNFKDIIVSPEQDFQSLTAVPEAKEPNIKTQAASIVDVEPEAVDTSVSFQGLPRNSYRQYKLIPSTQKGRIYRNPQYFRNSRIRTPHLNQFVRG